MDHRLIEGLMEVIAPLIKTYVDDRIAKDVAPLHAKVAEFKAVEPVKGDPGEPGRDGKDVEAIRSIVQAVAGNVSLSGSNDALLLLEADRIFTRLGILARLDLDKSEDVAVPGDHIDFAGFGAVRRGHDSIAESSKMVDCEDLGSPAERQETMEE